MSGRVEYPEEHCVAVVYETGRGAQRDLVDVEFFCGTDLCAMEIQGKGYVFDNDFILKIADHIRSVRNG